MHWRGAMEGWQHGGGAVLFRSFWWIESRKPEGSALALAFGRLEEAALAIETPRSARFGAAACAVGRPARERSAECELAQRAVASICAQTAPSPMARATPKRLASLLAARGGGAEAFPTARAMEIGARAAGRRAGRQRKHGSSRSRLSSIERTRCARSGNEAGIRPHRRARPRHRYPHVALGSAQLLVWLVWPRAHCGGNVNLCRFRVARMRAKRAFTDSSRRSEAPCSASGGAGRRQRGPSDGSRNGNWRASGRAARRAAKVARKLSISLIVD